MKKGFVFLISLLLILSVFSLPKNGLAQEINEYNSEFTIELVPSDPKPNDLVFAKVVSYQFDINRSVITWILDGKIIAQGAGKKEASFTISPLGKETALTVNITTYDGIKTSQTNKFSGSDIDFLWEAQTTAPSGYKGKALPGYKSNARVTALPHLYSAGARLSPSSLIYEWSFNYKNDQDLSGLGKNSILFKINDFGEFVIGLKVSSRDKRASFQKSFRLSAEGEPKLIFYSDDPLEGPFYGKALPRRILIKSKDFSIRGEPYFINKNAGGIFIDWTMNDKKIKSGKYPNILSLAANGDSGEAEIEMKIKKEGETFVQTADQSIRINF